MIKKKSLFKNISLFLCLVPMLLLSFFCLIPQKQDYNVSAASSSIEPYYFYGVKFSVPITVTTTSGAYDLTTILSVYTSFGIENGSFIARISGTYIRKDLVSVRTISEVVTLQPNTSVRVDCDIPGASGYIVPITIHVSPYFITKNVDRVTTTYKSNYSTGLVYNTLYYSDGINTLGFEFTRNFAHFASQPATSSDIFYSYDFDPDTYFFDLITEDVSNNVYYQSGYTDGYNQGVVDGSSLGYQDGYTAGETIGYGNGYNEGLAQGGNYTFMSLIGAVVDAPVSAFTSLLNFELLGVNILALITGLLSIAIIVLIVKLCMGGR